MVHTLLTDSDFVVRLYERGNDTRYYPVLAMTEKGWDFYNDNQTL